MSTKLSKRALTENVSGSDLEWCRYALQYCINDKDFRISHPFTVRRMEPTYLRICMMGRRITDRLKDINNSQREMELIHN